MLYYMKKSKKGDVILQAIFSSESLLWQSQIYVDVSTDKLRIKNDCTYTIVTDLDKTVSGIKNEEYVSIAVGFE